MKSAILCSLMAVAVLVGCNRRQGSDIRHGALHVVATESHLTLVQRLASDYCDLFPGVTATVSGTSTRGAIVDLVNGKEHCIVVDRRLNEEEHKAADNAGLVIGENEVAHDALVIVVNQQNALASLSTAELEAIVAGRTRLWPNVPASKLHGAIEICLTGRNSGLYELLTRTFFKLPTDVPLTAVASSQDSVLQYVAANPEALGIVSFAVWKDTTQSVAQRWKKNVRTVALLAKGDDGVDTAVNATQRSIYDQVYPLTYSLFVFTSEKIPGTGYGFSAFVTGEVGQRDFLYAGLVPKILPYRTIQLTQE